jgi:hypothetical protein
MGKLRVGYRWTATYRWSACGLILFLEGEHHFTAVRGPKCLLGSTSLPVQPLLLRIPFARLRVIPLLPQRTHSQLLSSTVLFAPRFFLIMLLPLERNILFMRGDAIDRVLFRAVFDTNRRLPTVAWLYRHSIEN